MGCAFLVILGFTMHASLAVLFVTSFCVGLCVSGGQKSVIALATLLYPPASRGTGLGWALGIGRVGGIAGPWLLGAMINPGSSPATLFTAMGIPMLLIGVMILLMGRLYGTE